MILHCTDGSKISFQVVDYQFPKHYFEFPWENGQSDWDANWLNIYIRVEHQDEVWDTISPIMTTWEFNYLINSLESLLVSTDLFIDEVNQLEHFFSLHLTNIPGCNDKILGFDIYYNPNFRINKTDQPAYSKLDKLSFFESIVTKAELKDIIKRLKKMSEAFPVRPGV